MPRGGKRPGAGAPKGNLNALKHGLRSRQFEKLGSIIAGSPVARETLLALADRHDLKQRKADDVAAFIISQVVARGLKRGREGLIVLPPTGERHSIKESAAAPPSSEPAPSGQNENPNKINQTPNTKSAHQSPTQHETALD